MRGIFITSARAAGLAARNARALTFVLAWLPCSFLAAQTPAPDQGAEAKTEGALSPELEGKVTEFLKKMREARRKDWEAEMKKRVSDVVKVTGLDATGVKALEDSADQAVDSATDDWAAKVGKMWGEWAKKATPEEIAMAEQAMNQPGQATQSDPFDGALHPTDKLEWKAGLQAALSAEQFAKWERAEKEQRDTALGEIGGAVRTGGERIREQRETALKAQASSIKNTLRLSQQRAEQLDGLAGELAKSQAEKWRERCERFLLGLDPENRRNSIRNGQFFIPPVSEDEEAMETAWQAGIAKLLSPEELARLKVSKDELKQRRIAALAQILLLQLDEHVAFTADQRERLRAVAERVVKADALMSAEPSDENHFQISGQSLLAAGRAATEAELKPILDATQLQHWQDACTGENVPARRRGMLARPVVAAVKTDAPTQAYEPEDLEIAISNHLHEKATEERRRLLAIQMLKAEDAARVTNLAPAAARRLAIAARGTAEEELALWKANTEQSIRTQLRDVTPENVMQRLAGLDHFGSGRRTSPNPDVGAIWENCVKMELSDAQRAAWKKELQARSTYGERAITHFILLELDRRVPLASEQWQKLEPLITAAVRDYGPDIMGMFSYGPSDAWYLQSHSMFLPVAAIPEKQLKEIFTKEQMERWTTGEAFGNISSYWENIQRLHTNRMKERKP